MAIDVSRSLDKRLFWASSWHTVQHEQPRANQVHAGGLSWTMVRLDLGSLRFAHGMPLGTFNHPLLQEITCFFRHDRIAVLGIPPPPKSLFFPSLDCRPSRFYPFVICHVCVVHWIYSFLIIQSPSSLSIFCIINKTNSLLILNMMSGTRSLFMIQKEERKLNE